MFISELLSDTNFGLASFIILVYLTINNNNRIDGFTNTVTKKVNFFETLLQFIYNLGWFVKYKKFFPDHFWPPYLARNFLFGFFSYKKVCFLTKNQQSSPRQMVQNAEYKKILKPTSFFIPLSFGGQTYKFLNRKKFETWD